MHIYIYIHIATTHDHTNHITHNLLHIMTAVPLIFTILKAMLASGIDYGARFNGDTVTESCSVYIFMDGFTTCAEETYE